MFIRVQDKDTGHQYDIDERTFRPELHRRLDKRRWPPSKTPRPARPRRRLGLPATTTDPARGSATADTPE